MHDMNHPTNTDCGKVFLVLESWVDYTNLILLFSFPIQAFTTAWILS